jgi:hypothetical protein
MFYCLLKKYAKNIIITPAEHEEEDHIDEAEIVNLLTPQAVNELGRDTQDATYTPNQGEGEDEELSFTARLKKRNPEGIYLV